MGWTRTDDLDGSPAEQHTFGLDGKAYAIDLSDANAAKLLKALQPFLTVAQPYGEMPAAPEFLRPAPPLPISTGSEAKPRKRGKQSAPVTAAVKTIRDWANANGYQVAPKGRIPAQVVAAYTEAHS
jgi:hypothetical protein